MRAGLGTAALVALLHGGCSPTETSTAPEHEVEEPESGALEYAIAKVEAGELSDGIRLLEDLVPSEAVEIRVEALRWLGHAHTRNIDPEAALVAYREALQLEPQDPWLHYAAGTAQFTIGNLEEAIVSYSNALAIDDTHLKSLQWRGHTQTLLERHAEAVLDFERALTLLESATREELADWGGDREQMMSWTRSELERSREILQR